MDAFERAVAFTLGNEGELSDEPEDSGGLTKYGISQRSYPHVDIANLTRDEAIEIYRADFWAPYKEFPEKVAVKVFDLAVNMGHRPAVTLLQRALRSCGADLADDGILGPLTRQAVAVAQPDLLVAALRSEAAGFHRLLAGQKPANKKFLNGWIKRSYL